MTTNTVRGAIAALAPMIIFLTVLLPSASAQTSDPLAITDFKFEVLHNPGKIPEDIIADIYGDSLIVGIIPFQQSDFTLKATFAAGSPVKVNGVDQVSTVTVNDFSSPLSYVTSSGGNNRTYKVKLISTGLPLVYVYTDNAAPILNREDYVDGTLKIYPNEEGAATFSATMEIRGRGNTTWTYPKKPYRIKLGTAASILGMPSDRDWILLANYGDKTLMRNSLAYHLGAGMNLAYTPRTTPVDVVLNGVYQGSYLIGEHVKADKDRVNIKELEADDTGEEIINGGYFLELDTYRDGIFFELASGLPFVIKSPDEDELTQEQLDYIKGYMQQTEDAIFSADFTDPAVGYAKYINPETFIEWYWVSEVLKNIDAVDVSSIFYYKDRNAKLNMGPLWDFDVASGNASVRGGDDPTSFIVRDSKWFKRLFEDPAFRNAVESRWFTFRDELLSGLPDVIDQYADKLHQSQQLNFYKWDILDEPIWPSTIALGSYDEEVYHLKSWLTTRIAWIDSQIMPPPMMSFNLTAPQSNTRVMIAPDDEGDVKFSWTPSTSGSSYEVLIDTLNGDFSDPLGAFSSDNFSADTIATISMQDLHNLYDIAGATDSIALRWTVRAWMGEREVAALDTFMIKLVNGVVATPVLHSPAAAETVETLSPTMKWFTAYLAEEYDVQVSLTESFETLVVDKTGLPDTTYSITEALTDQTTYYWRTRAVNADDQSEWSEVRSFTTPVIMAVGDMVYQVAVFPNPTSRELFIEIPSSAPIEHAELVDALGRTAASSALSPGTATRIDVSSLQRGMYVVILRGKIDKPLTNKIVLR